jgi:6-phosphofructokinase 1
MSAGKLQGNLVVGQSGGPTAVINASLLGVIEEAKRQAAVEGIYGLREGVLGLLEENLVDLRAESEQTLAALLSTPSAALGSCRKKLSDADFARIQQVLQAHQVRFFLYIGGNDSADTSHHIGELAKEAGWELRVIGIPKTVDNDLEFTDHCPGYGSVARFNALAVRGAGRDTEALRTVDHVKVIETMGRNTGWITASTAFAREQQGDPPHLIYLPERPFDRDRFLREVKRIYDRGRGVVIAVCEGLKDEAGEPIIAMKQAVGADSFGHKQLGGVSQYLCNLITDETGLKARSDKPGTIQRVFCLAVSETDQEEARLVGKAAVRAAAGGESDKMVTLVRQSNDPYHCTTGLALLEAVANAEKKVPEKFISAEGNDITPAFLEYTRPLLGGPLPSFARLRLQPVPKRLQAE